MSEHPPVPTPACGRRPNPLLLALPLAALVVALLLAAAAPAEGAFTGRVCFLALDVGVEDPVTGPAAHEERCLQHPDDRDTLFAHGTAATKLIEITDLDLADETHRVRVTSVSDQTGEEVTLHRVGNGVYHGLIGFEGTRVSGSGNVFVRHNDLVTVIYTDEANAAGQTVTTHDFLRWQRSWDGEIFFGEAEYQGLCTSARITVLDDDKRQSVLPVRVTSDSDPDGVVVNLNIVADGEHTGTVSFSNDPSGTAPCPGAEPRIFVSDGDTITAAYENPGHDARGDPEHPSTSATWRESHTARIQFVAQDYRTVVQEGQSDPPAVHRTSPSGTPTTSDASLWIRLEDPDLRGAGSVDINVRSVPPIDPVTGQPAFSNHEVNPSGRTVTLTETGTDTGEFIGVAGLATGISDVDPRLRVRNEALVEAVHEDQVDQAGDRRTVVSTVQWFNPNQWSLRFCTTDGCTATATKYDPTWDPAGCQNTTGGQVGCHPNEGHLELQVPRSLGSTATVRLTSLRDTAGIPVVLQGTDGATSTLYRASFAFNHTHSSPLQQVQLPPQGPEVPRPVVWAPCASNANPEQVTVTFVHKPAVAGLEQTLTRNVPMANAADGCTQPGPNRPSDTAVRLKLSETETGAAANSFTGYRAVHVELRDPDLNQAQTTRTVTLASERSNPVTWNPDLTQHPDTAIVNQGSQVSITLTRVGTGDLYRGTIVLAPALLSDNPFGTSSGERFCVHWLHRNAGGDSTVVRRTCADWTPAAPARLELRDTAHQGVEVDMYRGLSEATVFVRDPDRFTDTTTGTDTVTVRVVSSTDQQGFTFDLVERYGSHRMAACAVHFGGCPGSGTVDDRGFLGTFRFTDTGASDPANRTLRVTHGDLVSVFYEAGVDQTGTSLNMVTRATWNRTVDGAVSLDRDLYRAQPNPSDPANFAVITVVDRDLSLRTAALDQATVRVENDRTGDWVTVRVTETGSNTGVFRGEAAFQSLAADPSYTTNGALGQPLGMFDEDTFTVVYTDVADRLGRTVERTASAQWLDVASAHITLDRAFYHTYTDPEGATITMEAPDLSTTSARDTVRVWVFSDTDGGGEFLQLTETTGTSGVFVGGFSFEAQRTLGNGLVNVRDGDRVTVYYLDRNVDGVGGHAPVMKAATAVWRLEMNHPPELTLDTDPPHDNGTLRVDPGTEVRFSLSAVDPDGQVVSWRLDFGDGSTPLQSEGAPPSTQLPRVFSVEGVYTVRFSATDDEGETAEKTIALTVAAEDTDPPGPITGLAVRERLTTHVRLEWTVPQNNVAAQDNRPPDGYEIRFSAEPIASEADFENASEAVTVLFDPILGQALPGGLQSALVGGLERQSEYHFAVRATDLGGNVGDFRTVTAETLANVPAPRGAYAFTSSHTPGQASEQRTLTIQWSPLTPAEPGTSVVYHYALNEQAAYTASASDNFTAQPRVELENVVNGSYFFHVVGCSEDGVCGGPVTWPERQDQPIIIGTPPVVGPVPPSTSFIADVNSFVEVQVLRDGTTNVVRYWLPGFPDGLPTGVTIGGVQIWNADNETGPYSHLDDVLSDADGFPVPGGEEPGEYRHENAPRVQHYKVTVFFEAGGQRYGYHTDPGDVPGFESQSGAPVTGAEGPEGWSWWAWLLLALVVVAVLALVAGLVLVLRGGRGEDGPEEEEGEGLWAAEEQAWPAADEAGGWPAVEDEWPAADDESGEETPFGEEAPDAGEAPFAMPGEGVEGEPFSEEEAETTFEEEPGEGDDGLPDEHHMSCPECGALFTAEGLRPLLTRCPGCGAKGVLR